MRACPFTDCPKTVPDGKFVCDPHWYGLTRTQKLEVYRIYHAYVAGEMGIEELARR
jgi:hypothetical protein